MPAQKNRFGPLGPWIAPALGVGLVLSGIAMALGMPGAFGPVVAVCCTAVVLAIGKRRLDRQKAVKGQ